MTKRNGVSAILLAGGRNSRMGRCKAKLPWMGTTLIEHQLKKLRSLGIEDIVISGYDEPIDGTRFAEDLYKLKGPLGGIHAGLKAAEHEHCLVLAVDTPLVPVETLSMILERHANASAKISILAQSMGIEPLMGVYDKCLVPPCEAILQTENTSIRELYKQYEPQLIRYEGDESLLLDCNTPEDYRKAYAAQIE